MAIKQVKVSDLSGQEDADVTVVVRTHPAIDQPKAIDVTAEEAQALKPVTDLIVLELRTPDSATREIHVRQGEFDKWCPPDVLKEARGLRGRQPGYRPGNGS